MGNFFRSSTTTEVKSSKVVAIENYIDDFLQDEEINSCLPDKMERKMYKNVLVKTITLLEKVLETTEIQILNHRIRLVLEPTEQEQEEEEDSNIEQQEEEII